MSEPIAYNQAGLVACVVQHAESGVVLMMGWMNEESLQLTRTTKQVHFYSRSRQTLWRKGETSGNTLQMVSLSADCDRDCLLCLALPAGPTCHTGVDSCFFVDGEAPALPWAEELFALERTIAARRSAPDETSYTSQLLHGGAAAINAKIREEAEETAGAIDAESDDRVAAECADLLYHLLVGLGHRQVRLADVMAQLRKRRGVGGLVEKASR